eukprot:TRINITY_DN3758_c0_g3_i2.p1 TRINITY_DN3758_c0_g3~~TRINITY_DN3758_c0_g3_i2.p1  ORF type:complete len:270 (-),score=61.59 TRINITY_DN3758_c0_g3_i2:117-926(-)
MGAHCCCCCSSRDGGEEEQLKTPLRPTAPGKAEKVISLQVMEANAFVEKARPAAAMQSPEANGAVQKATPAAAMLSPEADGAVQEAPAAIEMEALEANGVEGEALQALEENIAAEEAAAMKRGSHLSDSPSTALGSDSLNESFETEQDEEAAEVDSQYATWTFVAHGPSNFTSDEAELITKLLDYLVTLDGFTEALETKTMRRLYNKLVHPWAGDEKQLYLHYEGVAGSGHQKTAEFRVISWQVEHTFTLTWAWDAVLDEEDFKFPSSA